MKHVRINPVRHTVTPYNKWVHMNPEYYRDDELVACEIQEIDAEFRAAVTYREPHGFNGHDPLSEDPFTDSEISFHDSWYDSMSDYYCDSDDHSYLEPEDFKPDSGWDDRYDEPWEYEEYWRPEVVRQAQCEFDHYLDLLDADRIRKLIEVENQLMEPDPYEHLPSYQSHWAGVYSGPRPVRKFVRAKWRRPYGKRYKPSHRPFVLERYKSA